MLQKQYISVLDGCGSAARRCTCRARVVVAGAAKTAGKGFGKAQPKPDSGKEDAPLTDKQIVRDAASLAGNKASKFRPVRPEEASRGKLDYVQVADWGDGDRAKLGGLRVVSHVAQYEGPAAAAAGPGSGSSSGSSSAAAGGSSTSKDGQEEDRRPFHTQLAHQLQLAEARGALAVAGPPPPPLAEWSFREHRYRQYLADFLEVHTALEAALQEATAAAAAVAAAASAAAASAALSSTPATTPPPVTTSTTATSGGSADAAADGTGDIAADIAAAAAAVAAAPPPTQCAMAALLHLAPGHLGLERGAALAADLAALRATADHPAAVAAAAAAAAAGGVRGGAAVSEDSGRAGSGAEASTSSGKTKNAAAAAAPTASGPMARSYGQVISRLGRVAAGSGSEQERQTAALRLLAHAAVLHLVGQAVWVRVGATAAERLALLQRAAASAYHDYPEGVRDPRLTLARALDAAGAHIRSPTARQVVYDEMAGAMQKTGLLMAALAHRD